jgi:hypothetical protein
LDNLSTFLSHEEEFTKDLRRAEAMPSSALLFAYFCDALGEFTLPPEDEWSERKLEFAAGNKRQTMTFSQFVYYVPGIMKKLGNGA